MPLWLALRQPQQQGRQEWIVESRCALLHWQQLRLMLPGRHLLPPMGYLLWWKVRPSPLCTLPYWGVIMQALLRGSAAAVVAAAQRQHGSGSMAAVRQQRGIGGGGGRGQLGQGGGSMAAAQHQWRWQRGRRRHCCYHAANARRRGGGNKDTSGNSNGRGTESINNQLNAAASMATDTATMAVTTAIIKMKVMVAAAEVRQAARHQRRQHGIMTDAAGVVDLDLHYIL
jgi:hypothetical protein